MDEHNDAPVGRESTGHIYITNAHNEQMETNRSGLLKLFALAAMGGFPMPDADTSPNAKLDNSPDGVVSFDIDMTRAFADGLRKMYGEVPDEQVSPDQVVHSPVPVDDDILHALVEEMRQDKRAQGYPEHALARLRAVRLADFEFGPNPPDAVVISPGEEADWHEPVHYYWSRRMKAQLSRFIDLFEDGPITISRKDLRPSDARLRDALADQEREAQRDYIDRKWGVFAATAEGGYKRFGRGFVRVEFLNGREIAKMTFEEELDALADTQGRFMLAYVGGPLEDAPDVLRSYNPAREIVVLFPRSAQATAHHIYQVSHLGEDGKPEPLWRAARDFRRQTKSSALIEVSSPEQIDQMLREMPPRERRHIKRQFDDLDDEDK